MKKAVIAAAVAALFVSTPAYAAEGFKMVCGFETHTLIAPTTPVKLVQKVTEDLLVMHVDGDPEKIFSPEGSLVTVSKSYNKQLFVRLLTLGGSSTQIGITEGNDKKGDLGLWLSAFTKTSDGCFEETLGDRVYAERLNAPIIFWKDIQKWEDEHPEAPRLVYSPK